MSKTDRHSQRIGCMGTQWIRDLKYRANHGLDLRFSSSPVSYNGLLDFQGAEFLDGDLSLGSGKNGQSAGLPEEHGAFHISGQKGFLHAHELGRISFHFPEEAMVNFLQSLRQGLPLGGMNGSASDISGCPIKGCFDDPEARAGQPWINPDDSN